MPDQLELAAFFKVREQTKRRERLGVQSCIRYGVGQARVYKWRKPVKPVLKAIVPVKVGAAAAEAVGRAAGGRGKRQCGTIIQRLVRRAHGKTKISIAQSVVGHVRSGRGRGAIDLRGGGLRVGKINWHAGKYAEMLVEIVSRVGIELEDLAVRVQRALELFKSGESFSHFRCRWILAESTSRHKQRKHTNEFS